MPKFKSLFAALLVIAFAAVPSSRAQSQFPYTYSNKSPSPNLPGGFCATQTTPVYNYVTGVYWYCVPNTAAPGFGLGTWTSSGLSSNTVLYSSTSLTLAQLQALNTAPVLIIPATGVGTVIEVTSCMLNLVYGSAAYAGGGTVQLSYGAATTYPASVTVAAATFTSLAANQVNDFAGALAATASSNVLNTAVYLFGNTANFTGGTGGSGLLQCAYRVHAGIS